MFRYERPQAGRQRQFWQFGCEVFGNLPPVRDAELIQMVLYLFSELGLKDGLQTIVNSIGCKGCRPAYVERLSEYFQETLELLCDDCRRKAKRNPLRILDCKREKCQNVSKGAPLIESYLCSSCSLHMREALRYLDYLKVNYEVNPRLVRGLDYYTRTVFEIIDSSLGAKDALAAGGRYDDLVEDFGGPSTSAIGFAAGIERIILSLKNSNLQQNLKEKIDIYITAISDRAIETVLKVAKDLRANGIRTKTGYKERSLKKEARLAARLGVRFLLVIGEDEIKAGVVKPKDILKYKELEEVQIGRIVEWAKRSLRR
jgi:histidyl-tRNA synthetase